MSAAFRNASTVEESVPQGLKPEGFSAPDGTAEAVPFPKTLPEENLPKGNLPEKTPS